MKELVRLNCEGIKFRGLNDWDIVDFDDVKTVIDFKKKVIENYVILCRKCAAFRYCKFRNDKEDKCGLSEKFINNYIDKTIKTIFIEDSYSIKEYVRSIIYILKILERFENWKGVYLDDSISKWFGPSYPKINLHASCDLLESLSKYLNAYRHFNIEREYKFRLFVEGDCEAENMPEVINGIGLPCYVSKDDVINLRGAGNLSKKQRRIELLLKEFKKNSINIFMILDNDSGTRRSVDDLIGMNLLKRDNVFIFKKAFEDAFPMEVIMKSLQEMGKPDLLRIEEKDLKKILSSDRFITKEIDKYLRGISSTFRISDEKKKFARFLGNNLISNFETGKLKRKRPEILIVIRKLSKLLSMESHKFYYG